MNQTSIPERTSSKGSFMMRKKADCYMQKFLKFDGIGTFHSLSELLHAALLESDSTVTSFIPQPKPVVINDKRYIPDCRYVKNGEEWLVELKPRGEFTESKKAPLEEHARANGYNFKVVSNEGVLSKKIKADNWLRIIRALVSAKSIHTVGEEERLQDRFFLENNLTFGEVIDSDNRIAKYHWEIALYRLAHAGIVVFDFDQSVLNLQTRVRLCD